MYLTRTSILFNCVDRSDSATSYQNGNTGDRYKMIWQGYFQKGCTYGNNTWTPALVQLQGGVITAIPAGDAASPLENFIQDNYQVGETIILPQSASNSSTVFTITAVTATTLTVSGAMVNETCTSNIWVTNLITSFDFYYNLISATATNPSFQSLTDATQQKFIIGASTGTFTNGTTSSGWVTDVMPTISAGSITSDYRQPFTITQYFFITPLMLNAPAYPLTYCYQVNGYYTTPPVINASIAEVLPNGVACSYNQNNSGTTPEFSVSAISYIDDATGLPLPSIDFSKTNDVTLTVNSASGLFTSSMPSVNFILSHTYQPAVFQNTATNLRQNFMNDRAIQIIGAAAVNGEFYGGNYSILQNVTVTYVNANTVTVSFKAIYTSYLQAILKTGSRNYSIEISVET